MAQEPRSRPREIVIMPSSRECGSPRYGTRTAIEHDVNDSFNARMNWHRQYDAEIQAIKREAADKAVHKFKEEMTKGSSNVRGILVTSQIIAIIQIIILKVLHVL